MSRIRNLTTIFCVVKKNFGDFGKKIGNQRKDRQGEEKGRKRRLLARVVSWETHLSIYFVW
jgi:hypothetical protein